VSTSDGKRTRSREKGATHAEKALSPAVETLMAMVRAAPLAAAAELERALWLRLTPEPTALESRVSELGALHALLVSPAAHEAPGTWAPVQIDRDLYERLRPEGAPSAKTLVGRYGEWASACRAALSMVEDGRLTGPGKPWKARAPGAISPPPYTREECIAGYRACALALGRRPTSGVYENWVLARRRRRRRQGGRTSAAGTRSGPRLPGRNSIRRHFRRWSELASAAALTDAELDAAWRHRLCVLGDPQPAPSDAYCAATRLGRLSAEALTELGLSADERERLVREGLHDLPLAQAAPLAHALSGSLDWLAGRTLEPSPPAAVALVFDGDAYKRLRGKQKVPEDAVLETLDWTLGQLRRVMTGRDEPPLGALTTIASLLGVETKELCRVP